MTGVTVRARVEVEVPAPSVTVTVATGAVPFQSATGVKRNAPSRSTRSVPLPAIVAVVPAAKVPVTPATVNWVTLRAEPSTSESFVRTLPAMAASSAPVATSFTVTGASLTAVKLNVRVETAVLLPSVMVTVAGGTSPLQLAAGVNE